MRRKYLFSGNVQGVGFRDITRRMAAGYPVTGYVKNLPDGRVELVADGSEDQLQAFVSALQNRMVDYIRETVAASADLNETFTVFDIRR